MKLNRRATNQKNSINIQPATIVSTPRAGAAKRPTTNEDVEAVILVAQRLAVVGVVGGVVVAVDVDVAVVVVVVVVVGGGGVVAVVVVVVVVVLPLSMSH